VVRFQLVGKAMRREGGPAQMLFGGVVPTSDYLICDNRPDPVYVSGTDTLCTY